ncbi:unnamed protein product [Caenorhabditis bovis]|uniref:Protein HGH1 homolog n=1 Tax=Caenorhabditis bovis TaxID=2654633 RepID=A0A8S1ETK1_9PELO|nr:unnamed protein product [Caenorhabditis bovis]
MSGEDEEKLFLELVDFISPTALLTVRRAALEYITGVSASLDGSAGQFFSRSDFAMAKAICNLCEATASDRTQTLAALTNFTSGSAEAANFVLTKTKCIELSYTATVTNVVYASVASRLLANVSRHFPDRFDEKLRKFNEDYTFALLNEIKKSVESDDEERAKFIGFIIVNLTVLPLVRERFVKGNSKLLPIVYELLLNAKTKEIRECAADILRNLAFDDGLHVQLLDTNDDYLVAVLAPLMDVNDNLDEEEIAKLPLRLQYYEKSRDENPTVRQKLIEALFQLCATKHGRQVLRAKGVYAAMRELDKSGETESGEESERAKTLLSSQQEHTLHALIGILIRYESEMDVDPSLETIRHLGAE